MAPVISDQVVPRSSERCQRTVGAGVPEAAAREAFRKAHHKLPVDTKVIMREEVYS